MRNWAKWRARKEARSERARRAAEARWAAVREARAGEPVRQTRVVEIDIRDTIQPRRTIRMKADPTDRGYGRWMVGENGQRIGTRRFGATAIARLIAESLR